jgi:hypothetical protein
MTLGVRVGVEWVNIFPENSINNCGTSNLPYQDSVAGGFANAMRGHGHALLFNWGDQNAWATDFEHPSFGGDSLTWSDNVHFCYYADHGGDFGDNILLIGFASMVNYCTSGCNKWKLGANLLKWCVFDCCDGVLNTDPNHIVAVWGRAMQGVHLVFTFIGNVRTNSSNSGRGSSFGNAAAEGRPLANAWLESAYSTTSHEPNRPIAIAAGVDRNDAINRRENENLHFRDIAIFATNWLAWKYRY